MKYTVQILPVQNIVALTWYWWKKGFFTKTQAPICFPFFNLSYFVGIKLIHQWIITMLRFTVSSPWYTPSGINNVASTWHDGNGEQNAIWFWEQKEWRDRSPANHHSWIFEVSQSAPVELCDFKIFCWNHFETCKIDYLSSRLQLFTHFILSTGCLDNQLCLPRPFRSGGAKKVASNCWDKLRLHYLNKNKSTMFKSILCFC